MKKLLLSATAAVAVALAASTPASAAILDGFLDGYSVVSGGTHAIFLSSTEAVGGEASFTVAGPLVPAGFTPGVIELIDPPSEGGGPSDFFGLKVDPNAPGELLIGMISDGASQADINTFNTDFSGANGTVLGILTETGLSQDVTAFFSADPSFTAATEATVTPQ